MSCCNAIQPATAAYLWNFKLNYIIKYKIAQKLLLANLWHCPFKQLTATVCSDLQKATLRTPSNFGQLWPQSWVPSSQQRQAEEILYTLIYPAAQPKPACCSVRSESRGHGCFERVSWIYEMCHVSYRTLCVNVLKGLPNELQCELTTKLYVSHRS